MAQEKTLTIRPALWSPAIAEMLAPAADSIADIAHQVKNGVASLYTVDDESGKQLAAFVLRVDQLAEWREGVIVAAAGDGDGTNLTRTILPVIETMSMFQDCETRRIHTSRPGLAKTLVKQHGYRLQELVLVKEMK